MKRADDFEGRRQHLAALSDAELDQRFWELAERVVAPMLELGKRNTTPSIERSVLLRMGFSSIEARAIVDGVMDRGLIGKGAGHVVYKLAKAKDLRVREAGRELAEGRYWDDVLQLFPRERL